MAEKLLIDKAVLGSLIDPLLISKASGASVSERFKLITMRKQLIKELDDKIGAAIFGRLSNEQWAEFEQLLEQDKVYSEEQNAKYDAFFAKHGIDEKQIMTEVAEQFAKDFLAREI